jgi:hypothetical protein
MTDFDKDFSDAIEQINKKIAVAKQALKEANEIAEKNQIEYYAPPHIDYYNDDDYDAWEELAEQIDWRDLMHELQTAGWSTSSMRC